MRIMKIPIHLIGALIVLVGVNSYGLAPAAKEFSDGNSTKYNTNGHAKAKGLNMTVAYPNSWMAKEGERPNIVQKFVSDGGHGLEMAVILTKPFNLPTGTTLTDSDLMEYFASDQLKAVLPQGAIFHRMKQTRIDGQPAGMIEYSARQERAGMTLDMRTVMFVFIQQSTLVMFQCAVTTSAVDSKTSADKMSEFMPLFFLMANSIVLENKWK